MGEVLTVPSDERTRVDADANNSKTVKNGGGGTVYYGGQAVTSSSNDGNVTVGNSVTLTTSKFFISASRTNIQVAEVESRGLEPLDVRVDTVETDLATAQASITAAETAITTVDLSVTGSVVGDLSVDGEVGATVSAYAADGSKQAAWGDLDLAAAAGTSTAGDSSFLGGVMGNVIGDALTKTHNYIAGAIGAVSAIGVRASLLQVGGVLGIVMDGVTDADGAVVAVIDGGDPSETTRANAAFAARINNNSGDSGVDYGLDLHDTGRDATLYTGGGDALEVAKADLRLSNEICIFSTATEPVDASAGDTYAEKGSLCVARDTGMWYFNSGTKADPVWDLLGEQGT